MSAKPKARDIVLGWPKPRSTTGLFDTDDAVARWPGIVEFNLRLGSVADRAQRLDSLADGLIHHVGQDELTLGFRRLFWGQIAEIKDGRRPGFWRHEITGVLQPVIEDYLRGERLTPTGIAHMRSYLQQWINSPVWQDSPALGLTSLRAAAKSIQTQEDIEAWLATALEMGIDPL